MLFIISSNNPTEIENTVNSEDNQTLTERDIVDELISRLEDEDGSDQDDIYEQLEQLVEEDDAVQENKWFFARLFNRSDDASEVSDENNNWELWEEALWNTDSNSEEANSGTLQDADDVNAWSHQATVFFDSQQSSNQQHLSKWASTNAHWVHFIHPAQQSVSDYVIDYDFEDGDMYSVNTHSLRLNNKEFTTTLWFLLEGDVLQQLSAKNYYGCFLVEVLESTTALWMKWYVCDRYVKQLPEEELIEESFLPIEEPLEQESFLPVEEVIEESFLPIEEPLAQESFLPVEEVIEESFLPVEEVIEESFLPIEEPISQESFLPAENNLEAWTQD